MNVWYGRAPDTVFSYNNVIILTGEENMVEKPDWNLAYASQAISKTVNGTHCNILFLIFQILNDFKKKFFIFACVYSFVRGKWAIFFSGLYF